MQGAIFAFLCRESLFIISCRFHLVKNFFNFFRSFFNLSNHFHVLFKTFSTCLPSSQTAYLVYHAKRGLSTTFFVCFQTFRFAPSFSRSDLISIRQRAHFVNTFLLFFIIFISTVGMLDFECPFFMCRFHLRRLALSLVRRAKGEDKPRFFLSF